MPFCVIYCPDIDSVWLIFVLPHREDEVSEINVRQKRNRKGVTSPAVQVSLGALLHFCSSSSSFAYHKHTV